jgi:hypothetical protein
MANLLALFMKCRIFQHTEIAPGTGVRLFDLINYLIITRS